jgi:hypothetical protein
MGQDYIRRFLEHEREKHQTPMPSGFVAIRCPWCDFIVHIQDIDSPARVSPSGSGREARMWLECEHGHRSALEFEDHSGAMTLHLRRESQGVPFPECERRAFDLVKVDLVKVERGAS